MTDPDALFPFKCLGGNDTKTRTTIRGFSLLELIQWASTETESTCCRDYGVFGLPPVQRGLVWKPKQIVDLWDSVFRGLPIGAFYLARRDATETARKADTTRLKESLGSGWSLLDGQQRLHALISGWQGPPTLAKDTDPGRFRCLWVDLGAPNVETPMLHLTSNSQPFGYDPATGRKLHSYQIEEQRKRLSNSKGGNSPYFRKLSENDPDIKKPIREHELFAGLVNGSIRRTDARDCNWPPEPVLAKQPEIVFPLHYLLTTWLRAPKDHRRTEIGKLFAGMQIKPSETAIAVLCNAFEALERAEIALIDATIPKEKSTSEEKAQHMLRLFDRIGSGGSPLGEDDRLYSIYKSYKPKIYNEVEEISERHGAVMSPAKICRVALRIAYARTHQDADKGNYPIDVPTMGRNMAGALYQNEQSRRTSNLSEQLDLLIPEHCSAGTGLAAAFDCIYSRLGIKADPVIGLPDLMLASLSPNLIEVLALARLTDNIDDPNYWHDAVVFALLWELLVSDPNYAAAVCFAAIRRKDRPSFSFPDLYTEMTKASTKACLPLVLPEVMRRLLCIRTDHVFATHDDRFPLSGVAKGLNERDVGLFTPDNVALAKRWWQGSGESLLRWHQRDYLQALYEGFKPAFRSDEDMPYDIDHLIPRNEWGDNWQTMKKRLDKNLQDTGPYQETRGILGDSLGNKWLLDRSINRRVKDDLLREKLEILANDPNYSSMQGAIATINDDLRQAAGEKKGEEWLISRLEKFQRGIQNRAAELYDDFYDKLKLRSDRWQ